MKPYDFLPIPTIKYIVLNDTSDDSQVTIQHNTNNLFTYYNNECLYSNCSSSLHEVSYFVQQIVHASQSWYIVYRWDCYHHCTNPLLDNSKFTDSMPIHLTNIYINICRHRISSISMLSYLVYLICCYDHLKSKFLRIDHNFYSDATLLSYTLFT